MVNKAARPGIILVVGTLELRSRRDACTLGRKIRASLMFSDGNTANSTSAICRMHTIDA